MIIFGWSMVVLNVLFALFNFWFAFHGYPANLLVGAVNFAVGIWCLKVVLED